MSLDETNIKTFVLPDDLLEPHEAATTPVVLRAYASTLTSQRNRLQLNKVMINFLIHGHKTIILPEQTLHIAAGDLVILTPGPLLSSEILADDTAFESVLLYLDPQFLLEIQQTLATAQTSASTSTVSDTKSTHSRCACFQRDAFLNHFLGSLQLLMQTPERFSDSLKQAKIRELFAYLAELHPAALSALSVKQASQHTYHLQQIVMSHADSPVTVEELAFLSHMSLSAFKRAFQRQFGSSPGKWLVQHRLQRAHQQLSQGKTPSEVWLNAGYQDHSSFSKAFRRVYGYSPSDIGRFDTGIDP